MTASIRARIAFSAAQDAIAEMLRQDPTLSRDEAAGLLATHAFADIRGRRGTEAAAMAVYRLADAFVEMKG